MKPLINHLVFIAFLIMPFTGKCRVAVAPAGDSGRINTVKVISDSAGVSAKPIYNLYSYLAATLMYPKKAVRKHIEGEVIVSFVVDTDGSIHNAYIANPLGGGCDEEALAAIRKMPKWQPAILNGKPVKSVTTQVVTFWLEGGKELKGAAMREKEVLPNGLSESPPVNRGVIKEVRVRR